MPNKFYLPITIFIQLDQILVTNASKKGPGVGNLIEGNSKKVKLTTEEIVETEADGSIKLTATEPDLKIDDGELFKKMDNEEEEVENFVEKEIVNNSNSRNDCLLVNNNNFNSLVKNNVSVEFETPNNNNVEGKCISETTISGSGENGAIFVSEKLNVVEKSQVNKFTLEKRKKKKDHRTKCARKKKWSFYKL
ncbi:hypothetical protein HDU92_006840 [Lobulomyces angularis]|nr:hypothetical protein HDU92_006840 [Lobulomyces angularis]